MSTTGVVILKLDIWRFNQGLHRFHGYFTLNHIVIKKTLSLNFSNNNQYITQVRVVLYRRHLYEALNCGMPHIRIFVCDKFYGNNCITAITCNKQIYQEDDV